MPRHLSVCSTPKHMPCAYLQLLQLAVRKRWGTKGNTVLAARAYPGQAGMPCARYACNQNVQDLLHTKTKWVSCCHKARQVEKNPWQSSRHAPVRAAAPLGNSA